MSSVAGSSAAFEIFMIASRSSAGPDSRNVWSRSLPRFVADSASTPNVRAAIADRLRLGEGRQPGRQDGIEAGLGHVTHRG